MKKLPLPDYDFASKELINSARCPVYVFGDNVDKMLAAGTTEQIPLQPLSYFPFNNYQVADVPDGKCMATVIHLKNKKTGFSELFACGSSIFGHLTRSVSDSGLYLQRMDMTPFPQTRILHIAVGGDQVILQTEDLKLYGIGCNISGGLGIDKPTSRTSKSWSHIPIPMEVISQLQLVSPSSVFNSRVRLHSINCGYNHSVLLLQDHRHLIVWGENEKGQLGDCKTLNSLKPLLISRDKAIKKVVCGLYSTCLLTDEGEVYLAGENPLYHSKNSSWFTKLKLPKVLDVSISDGMLACLTTKLDVYWAFKGKIHRLIFGRMRNMKHRTVEEINMNEALQTNPLAEKYQVDNKTYVIADARRNIILANSKNQVLVLGSRGVVALYHDFGINAAEERIFITTNGNAYSGLRFFWKADCSDSFLFIESSNPLAKKSKQQFKDIIITW